MGDLLTATFHVNVAPPTASLKQRIMRRCRFQSAKSTRTVGTQARIRFMRCVALFARGARVMIP